MSEPGDLDPPSDVELLPPDDESRPDSSLSQTYLALVSNYTDRPDLLIAEIEKHDPGFVKRMNEASERDGERSRTARFNFSRFQAYTALGVSSVAALGIVVILGFAVVKGSATFGIIVAFALFFAVTQSGSAGFTKLTAAIIEFVKKKKDSDS